MKRILAFLSVLLFFSLLLFFPQQSLAGAKAGLMLWFYTLLPSMLPFLILSSLILHMGLLDPLLTKGEHIWRRLLQLSPQGAYALFMGILCGYPMGAKTTADLYRKGSVSRQEADYLLTFSNYPGPAFLLTYLCVGILQREDLAFLTCVILYLSSFLTSLFFRPSSQKRELQTDCMPSSPINLSEKSAKKASGSLSFGEALDASILNGFLSITKLGGYIILFSIFQVFLKKALPATPWVRYPVLGLMEITTGLSALSTSSLSFPVQYVLSLSFTSFGGFCVAAQTKSMLSGTDLSLLPYLKGKICCSFFTLIITLFLVKIIKVIV
ncbi:MAG: sporulation protein [Blautia sp.]|nr:MULTISPECIES: sporulation protein [Blautia]